MKVLVIGGGIFGCSVALELAKDKSFHIDLIEKDKDILTGASLSNHNRLHLGYHYLRSSSTAKQSIEGLLSFMFNYGDAALYQFPNYYAIAKKGSHTSTEQFVDFCDQVGIGYDEEFPDAGFLNSESVDSCFRVPEPIFDHSILKSIIQKRLIESKNIKVKLQTECAHLQKINDQFIATLNGSNYEYDVVINVTYSNINKINSFLGLKQYQLRYEQVFIPYFLYPSNPIGLTVMDGEFASIMPKGSNKNEFLLYHVNHSVIQAENSVEKKIRELDISKNHLKEIYQKSAYFYPFLDGVKHFGFWQTIRAVHENKDDARVTELFTYEDMDNYFTVFSGKIPTCMRVALHLKHILQGKENKKPFII